MTNSRDKGASAEREVIAIIQPVVDTACKFIGKPAPKLQRNLEQTRSGGCDIVGLKWLAIEVKRQERLSITKWWDQAVSQAFTAEPVLIYRQSRQPWRVRCLVRLGAECVPATVSINDWLVYLETEIIKRG